MSIVAKVTTLTSREFNQDLARAKRAAKEGPVLVTDRGAPSFVLLNYDDYERLKGDDAPVERRSIIDMLAMPPGTEDFDFEFPRIDELPRGAEFD